jgi:hypothetical protein
MRKPVGSSILLTWPSSTAGNASGLIRHRWINSRL